MAKQSKTFAGLFCPSCGAGESLNVCVETLTLVCNECDESIDRAAVDAMVAKWTALMNWIESVK